LATAAARQRWLKGAYVPTARMEMRIANRIRMFIHPFYRCKTKDARAKTTKTCDGCRCRCYDEHWCCAAACSRVKTLAHKRARWFGWDGWMMEGWKFMMAAAADGICVYSE